jgi:hypothetical protein
MSCYTFKKVPKCGHNFQINRFGRFPHLVDFDSVGRGENVFGRHGHRQVAEVWALELDRAEVRVPEQKQSFQNILFKPGLHEQPKAVRFFASVNKRLEHSS